MCVDGPTNGYELRAVRGEPAVELAGQGLGTGQRPGPLRWDLVSRPLQSSSHVGFRIALEGLPGFRNARQLRPTLVTLCNVIPVHTVSRRVTNALIRTLADDPHLLQRVTL
ncbi:hypothetical protein GCM10010172_24890 [Paractinoplanes ferrugineus]|uniref:Uncharacterized protein n=1 Tax=Paractinoplanes ferrugineus TaxID=113564 RepID=A0A919J113_9ACTN|nr:hypothetical protein Afe05nite_04410 [Actinoplanes ferrugineus]